MTTMAGHTVQTTGPIVQWWTYSPVVWTYCPSLDIWSTPWTYSPGHWTSSQKIPAPRQRIPTTTVDTVE